MSTNPIAPHWDIRTATADTMRAYTTPLPAAFAEDITDAEYDDWIVTVEPDRWIAAFDGPADRDARGSAGAFSFRLTVPGGEVPAAGVTGVAVRPDYRRRGILRALMRHQLDDVRRRGEPVAILWASEGAIYQRFGYGVGTMAGSIDVDVARTAYARPIPAEGRMRLLTQDEAQAAFPAVYDAMRRATPGAVTRTDDWWATGPLADREYSRRGAGPKFRYLYEVDGNAEGYALYRVRTEWDHRGPKGQLEVYEVVALTPRALRDTWRFLFETDLVKTVRAGRLPVPFPLQHLLAEPRALGLVLGDGIWLRLVDLPSALAARRYPASAALVLQVADPFCPWNAGRWLLDATGDADAAGFAGGRVTPTDAAPDLVLGIADLGAAYLGGVRLSDLAVAGRVEARAADALRRADALFASERTPWCVTMF